MRNSVLLYHLSSIWLPHIYKKWHSRELPASLSSSGIVPKCVWTWVTAGEGKAPHTFSSPILLLCLMSACLGSDGGLPALSLSYSFIPPSSILPSLVHLFLHFLLADHFAPRPTQAGSVFLLWGFLGFCLSRGEGCCLSPPCCLIPPTVSDEKTLQ